MHVHLVEAQTDLLLGPCFQKRYLRLQNHCIVVRRPYMVFSIDSLGIDRVASRTDLGHSRGLELLSGYI